MKLLLRLYSFVFLLPISLFLFALGMFGLIEGAYGMTIDFLPWTGKTLVYALAGLGLLGLVSIARAALGKMKFLFALFALFTFVLSVYAVLFSGHRYGSAADFQWALAFVAGAFGAFMGSLVHMRG